MPMPEVALWRKIRQRQLGVKFRRQYTVGSRILDFYSPEIKLGIEIDGESHFISDSIYKQNIESDKKLEVSGIKVSRFLNPDVMNNIDGVLLKIIDEIKSRTSPTSPLPLSKGEGACLRRPALRW